MIALAVAVLVLAGLIVGVCLRYGGTGWRVHRRIDRSGWVMTPVGMMQIQGSRPAVDVTVCGQPVGEPFWRWER